MKVQVLDDVCTHVTHVADPDDEWDRDSTHESHSIQGIKLAKWGYDVECSFEVQPGKDYFLLYYRYDSGDSFGQDTGRIEFVGLYEDRTLADKAAAIMNKHGGGSILIPDDQGKMYEEYLNDDYFGGFTHANVETVRLI